jgi:hypothetical protein
MYWKKNMLKALFFTAFISSACIQAEVGQETEAKVSSTSEKNDEASPEKNSADGAVASKEAGHSAHGDQHKSDKKRKKHSKHKSDTADSITHKLNREALEKKHHANAHSKLVEEEKSSHSSHMTQEDKDEGELNDLWNDEDHDGTGAIDTEIPKSPKEIEKAEKKSKSKFKK